MALVRLLISNFVQEIVSWLINDSCDIVQENYMTLALPKDIISSRFNDL